MRIQVGDFRLNSQRVIVHEYSEEKELGVSQYANFYKEV